MTSAARFTMMKASQPLNVDAAELMERDGYAVLRGLLDRERVKRVRVLLADLLARDIDARGGETRPVVRVTETGIRSALTPDMHTQWFPSWEIGDYSALIADMLDHPRLSKVRSDILGEDFHLRTCLIRESSGRDDSAKGVQLPHEWHRDALPEFTFGIFFDDMDEAGSGGTAVIPGTHTDPLDPRFDLMVNDRCRPDQKRFETGQYWMNAPIESEIPKTAMARKAIAEQAREITGRMGDVYLFANRVWHGRAPNQSGRKIMIARLGGVPRFDPSLQPPKPLVWPEGRALDKRLADRFTPPQHGADGKIAALGKPMVEPVRSQPVFAEAAAEKRKVLDASTEL